MSLRTTAIIAKFAQDLKENVIASSNVRAINRTLTTVRKEASIRAREVLKASATDVKDSISITKVASGTRLANASGIIQIKGKPIPLIKFGARTRSVNSNRGKRVGVSVNIKGVRKIVRDGFLATMKTGYVGVFARKGSERRPIKQLFTTSVSEIFQGGKVIKELEKFARQTFRKNLLAELTYQVGKRQKALAAKQ